MNFIKDLVSEWVSPILALVNFCSMVVGAISFLLLLAFGRLPDGISFHGVTLSWEMLAILIVAGAIIALNVWLFGRLLKGAANGTTDYKVICDRLPGKLQHELDIIDKAKPYVDRAGAEFCKSLDEEGFKDLLNSSDTTCRNLKVESKAGKIILQCSFIPVDSEGNTIIIRRRMENHASLFKKLKNWWKKIYSFISFSPIPDGHNRKFDSILSCYAHEVPVDGLSIRNEAEKKIFQYVGVIYNRRDGGNIKKPLWPWKKAASVKANLNKCIRYLFAVYLVRYLGLKFVRDDGKPNWDDINKAFAEKSKRESNRKDRFFLKDHDYIVGVDSLTEIASRLADEHDKERKRWLKVEQAALVEATKMVAADDYSSPSSSVTS